MATHREILSLEKKFWTEGADYYRANLDTKCLVAFTEMAGVMTREEVAASVKGDNRFKDVEMQEQGFLEIGDDVVMLTYKAKARRSDGTPHEALVSSGYAQHDGKWKMMFHQQAPLGKS